MYQSEPLVYPTYEQSVRVIIGPTLKEVCKEYDLPWDDGCDTSYDAYCQQVGEYIYVVLREDNSRRIVLHECVHAIDIMYANIEAKIDASNDEIYVRDVSYLQDIVLTMFENNIKKT